MNTLPLFGGAGFALFSIYMLKHALHNHKRALESNHWPTVRGKIVDVRLWGKRNIGGQMKDADHLDVKYEYEVQGTVHTGTSVTFYTLHYPETTDFAQNHPSNSEITVYYNPRDAAESVLVCGPKKGKPYSELILASLGIVAGVAVAVLGGIGVIG